MVYNDAVFLPIWWRYYGSAFGEENLFILDHGSNDGSTRGLGQSHVLQVPRSKDYDEDQRAGFISRCQAVLLSYYDAIIFTDADEILIPDPAKFASLPEFIERRCERFVNVVGLDLHHLPGVEEDIDLSRPILSQRSYVRFSAFQCKPLISKIPLNWGPGFHWCDYAPSIDPDLFMFHLKCMDMKLALKRLQTTRAISWSKNAHLKRHAEHHRLEDQEFIRQMFPYSTESALPHLIQGFDFSEDLACVATDIPNQFNGYQGGFAVIPQRFKHLIEGRAVHPNIDAKLTPRPLHGTGANARRALRRLIALNTLRDRCRPLAQYVRHWLTSRERG
jgi:hypothetical protein